MRRKVEDIRVDDGPTLDVLARRLEASGGFTAKAVGEGVDLLARILGDREMTRFLSFPAGLAELVRDGYVDAVITTCGTLDHDIARSFRPYYHGEWNLDDVELHRKGFYRLRQLPIPAGEL